MKRYRRDKRMPLFLFLLVIVLVLITFALITISDSLHESNKTNDAMQELKSSGEEIKDLSNEYFKDIN